jgi:two-component system OmpR family sensor kinase
VAILVAIALSGAGAIVYAIQSNQLESSVVEGIDDQLDAFVGFSQSQPRGTSLRETLVGFVSSHVPDDCALQVTVGAGKDKYVRGSAIALSEADRTLADPGVKRTISEVAKSGASVRYDASPYGPLLIAGQPVTLHGDQGAMVVISYLKKDGADLSNTMRTYLLVALLSLLLITALAAWQSGRLLAPLRTLRQTADEIRETDLSQRIPVRGNDDITQLTHTLNGMLSRLETAFAGQRQFLDDAGHELKTPLTILRGHLELLETGNQDEVEETRTLLLDEVDRMSRLVGELILLTKSDRPDFLAPSSTDLESLTPMLLAKCRGLGPRDWQVASLGSGTVHVDEQRITQAMLQLADNAVKHTGTDDTIALGTAYEGGTARFWVADSGPGVPPAERTHIFERFGRGAESTDDGFGLGLSIVAAIAEAHGGTLSVTDDPDLGGARFELTIPQSPQEQAWPAS